MLEAFAVTETKKRVCRWMSQSSAFREFVTSSAATQSADHIRPLHWYVACRLVLEGGFFPDDITPRPPFRIEKSGGGDVLVFAPEAAKGGEQTVLGGLKTKNVDVVVSKPGIGPVIAVSCKGVTGALRNLTNRLEETVGECTNLHITYPALVLGYLVLVKANKMSDSTHVREPLPDVVEVKRILQQNDIVLDESNVPVVSVVKFHNALVAMTGRQGIRDDISRYESIGFGLVRADVEATGHVVGEYPGPDSQLSLERFFSTMYARYDERFVLSAPELKRITRRSEWRQVTNLPSDIDYACRLP